MESIEHVETVEFNFSDLPMDKDEKELLELKYIDELSYKELAAIFDKSEPL